MKDVLKTIGVVVGLIVLVIAFYAIVLGYKTPRCELKYGKGATGIVGNVGNPDCQLPDGSGKYL